jgi:transglutaminase-like putative cysteine protease
MTRRLRIRHTTRVSYAQAAVSSHNEVRMTPLTLPGQTTLDARVTGQPDDPDLVVLGLLGHPGHRLRPDGPARGPHDHRVEPGRDVPAGALGPSPTWQEVTERTTNSRLLEFIGPTVRTTVPPKLLKKARKAAVGPRPARDGGRGLRAGRRPGVVPPGVTGVNTSAAEAWEQGAGVCQDIAHVTIALLRGLGLPTRYVSGYLHPEREAELHRPVAGQSHAWVEYWAGDWCGYDPTNRTRPDESHVVVGRGRDYDDVTPHKGIYRGVAGGPPEVTVEFTRVA